MPEPVLVDRVQRSRRKGWRKPPGAITVGRGTFWGNPYLINAAPDQWPLGMPWNRSTAVACWELMLASGYRLRRNPGLKIVERAKRELEGVTLVCWCPVRDDEGNRVPCHADALLAYANAAEYLDPQIALDMEARSLMMGELFGRTPLSG